MVTRSIMDSGLSVRILPVVNLIESLQDIDALTINTGGVVHVQSETEQSRGMNQFCNVPLLIKPDQIVETSLSPTG